MSAVHASRGPLKPASPHLRSEVDIVCSLAEATLGDRHGIPWAAFRADYTEIRHRIARVVPGCAAYDEKVDQPGGFVLPHPPRDSRTFPTEAGKAVFTASPIDVLHVPEGRLLLQTLRSHDQFNTTIYGLDDRYRGIKGGRRVVFVHPDDIAALGLADGDHGRPGQRVDATARSGPRPTSGWSPTTSRAAARRRTTRRPTRWSRWTPPRSAATARRRSRSSSGWSRRAAARASAATRARSPRAVAASAPSSRST